MGLWHTQCHLNKSLVHGLLNAAGLLSVVVAEGDHADVLGQAMPTDAYPDIPGETIEMAVGTVGGRPAVRPTGPNQTNPNQQKHHTINTPRLLTFIPSRQPYTPVPTRKPTNWAPLPDALGTPGSQNDTK